MQKIFNFFILIFLTAIYVSDVTLKMNPNLQNTLINLKPTDAPTAERASKRFQVSTLIALA